MEREHGVAIELVQVKTFKNPSFTQLYRGIEVVGTEKAIKDEMAGVWTRVKGEECEVMRAKMDVLREKCKQSWQGGESRKAMEAVAQFF